MARGGDSQPASSACSASSHRPEPPGYDVKGAPITVSRSLDAGRRTAPVHLLVDSTSVKLCGTACGWSRSTAPNHGGSAEPERAPQHRLAAPETYTVIRQRRCPDHLRVNRQQNLSGPAALGG